MRETAPRVIKIPAKPEAAKTAATRRQLRVAAYCRVSTKEEDQANSYEVQREYYTDKITELAALKKRITARVQSVVGISPNLKIMEPNTIERSMGKAKHAIDHRKFE